MRKGNRMYGERVRRKAWQEVRLRKQPGRGKKSCESKQYDVGSEIGKLSPSGESGKKIKSFCPQQILRAERGGKQGDCSGRGKGQREQRTIELHWSRGGT